MTTALINLTAPFFTKHYELGSNAESIEEFNSFIVLSLKITAQILGVVPRTKRIVWLMLKLGYSGGVNEIG